MSHRFLVTQTLSMLFFTYCMYIVQMSLFSSFHPAQCYNSLYIGHKLSFQILPTPNLGFFFLFLERGPDVWIIMNPLSTVLSLWSLLHASTKAFEGCLNLAQCQREQRNFKAKRAWLYAVQTEWETAVKLPPRNFYWLFRPLPLIGFIGLRIGTGGGLLWTR
jgi:hypothetical protein